MSAQMRPIMDESQDSVRRKSSVPQRPMSSGPGGDVRQSAVLSETDALAMAQTMMQSDSARGALRKMIVLNLILFATVVVLVVALLVTQLFSRAMRDTVGMSPDGRIVRLHALHEPIVNLRGLNRYADEAMSSAFTLDFLNWRDQIASSRPFFTNAGYEKYEAQLKTSGWLDRILAGREVLTFKSTSAWRVVSSGTLGGAALWVIQAPVVLEFGNDSGVQTLIGKMSLDIVRVPNIDNPAGIAVEAFVFAPGG